MVSNIAIDNTIIYDGAFSLPQQQLFHRDDGSTIGLPPPHPPLHTGKMIIALIIQH